MCCWQVKTTDVIMSVHFIQTRFYFHQPQTPGSVKRKNVDDAGVVQKQKYKKVALSVDDVEELDPEVSISTRCFPRCQVTSSNLDLVLTSSFSQVDAIDDTAVKKMILKFEKRTSKNQEMRIKFPDVPEKWAVMPNKCDWRVVVLSFNSTKFLLQICRVRNRAKWGDTGNARTCHSSRVLQYLNRAEYRAVSPTSSEPREYGHIHSRRWSAAGTLQMISLSMSVNTVSLLLVWLWCQELTEVDTLNENEEGADALLDVLLEGQITALLIQNMERLDESVKEEADGVYNSLGEP